jgi:hypothetical protein
MAIFLPLLGAIIFGCIFAFAPEYILTKHCSHPANKQKEECIRWKKIVNDKNIINWLRKEDFMQDKETKEEIDAIGKVLEALAPLSSASRKRVLEYGKRWGADKPPVKSI